MDAKIDAEVGVEAREFKTWTPQQQAFAVNTQKQLESYIRDRSLFGGSRDVYNNQRLLEISNAEAYLKDQPHDPKLAKDGIGLAINGADDRIRLGTDATERAAAKIDKEILMKVFFDLNGTGK